MLKQPWLTFKILKLREERFQLKYQRERQVTQNHQVNISEAIQLKEDEIETEDLDLAAEIDEIEEGDQDHAQDHQSATQDAEAVHLIPEAIHVHIQEESKSVPDVSPDEVGHDER